ncbi:MAG: 4-(cytidine 5'-diphospho)-2-C-methyl-D-erythritol kinase [Proteobacteria bacterium]|nr:4-(cytidine 5'-diphospho)-2-C-methyl-D-erythritol kinase [Pseudomonadota bacterium]NOG61515.1 4-(cytidine 5'-diphospho)-2-C-methyl-D-erythritol kinase [Pseudomonadota bacterium]
MLSSAWPAPAKLNLFLHITGRRADGYHLLQTVFQFIQLQDEIDYTILESDVVHRRSTMSGVDAEDDLVVRAARSLKEKTNCKLGVDINVKKRIPDGGGLGGGSSDAATTLVALNELWETGLSTKELAQVGLSLGADVPVFIHAHATWAEGVGEDFTSIEPEESWYLVVHPGCSVATAEIFSTDDLTRNTPAITIRDFLEGGGRNDCESVVRNHYKEVAKALDWLSGFAPAKLTGTGACLFAPFSDEQQAQTVKQQLPVRWQGYVVKGMNKSPLIERLAVERNKA